MAVFPRSPVWWSLLGAFGLTAGFPNVIFHVPPLVLLYPAALFVLGTVAETSRRAFLHGWLCGLIGISGVLYWLALPLSQVGNLPWPLAALCALGVTSILATAGAFFALAAFHLRNFSPLRRACMLGIIWYALEYLYAAVCSFPWLPLAAALAGWPVCIQPAAFTGAFALSGLIAMLAVLTVLARHSGSCRAAAVILLALLLVPSAWRLYKNPAEISPQGPDTRAVLFVEGNINQNQKWDPAFQQVTLEKYLTLTEQGLNRLKEAALPQQDGITPQLSLSLKEDSPDGGRTEGHAAPSTGTALKKGKSSHAGPSASGAPAEGTARREQNSAPSANKDGEEPHSAGSPGKNGQPPAAYAEEPPLVVWPETAMPFYVQSHPQHTPRIGHFAAAHGVPLLLGCPAYSYDSLTGHRNIFNRAYLIGPQGQFLSHYDKQHLVLFAEYVPEWLDFEFLRPLMQGVGIYSPGASAAPLVTGNLAMGVLICYEGIFPELAQTRVEEGANILADISNDGWFGGSAAPVQHLYLTVLRAVEQNRWLLRGTNTGISAVCDTYGRIILQGGRDRAQTLQGRVRLLEKNSFYHDYGWTMPLTALFLFAALCFFPCRKKL